MKKYALISRESIRGFSDPDTSSQLEGQVESGKYAVLQYLENHPDQNSDYVCIDAPHLGGNDTWICSRWKEEKYVEIVEEDHAINQSIDLNEMAIDERLLINNLPAYKDFVYDLDKARYPHPLIGVSLPLVPPESNNCCTFVEGLVVKAWLDSGKLETWSSEKHRQMMIMSADDFFSPITALVASNIANRLNPDGIPLPWTVIQGWRNQWRSGHTFIILDYHEPTDRVLTLESNSSYKLNGVGYRQIGNISSFPDPPAQWYERTDLWTWERIKSTYRYREMAALQVSGVSWVNG